MQRLFDLYIKLGDVEPKSKVLDTTDEGLLYHPEKNDPRPDISFFRAGILFIRSVPCSRPCLNQQSLSVLHDVSRSFRPLVTIAVNGYKNPELLRLCLSVSIGNFPQSSFTYEVIVADS